MQALVLETVGRLVLRDMTFDETLGPHDVRVAMHTVGICGSDIHYYLHGRIGPFVVEKPLVLGHEGSGTVVEVGEQVTHLKPGDRVCMEPGIPDPHSKAVRLGRYNLDPGVRFWATPPIHGCLRTTVVHPADFTFKLPDSVSYAEGAMVEPLAVGLYAAVKARIVPGDLAVVIGAGTIGLVTVMSALAGGCGCVVVADVQQPKLDIARQFGSVVPVNIKDTSLVETVMKLTDNWGADIVFEASGNSRALAGVFDPLCPGGRVVLVGMPPDPVPIDIVAAQAKEARIETVFRYAHVYPRALTLLAEKKIDLKPLITTQFNLNDAVQAFDFAASSPPTAIKTQILLPSSS
jgi:D-xylulose reductase